MPGNLPVLPTMPAEGEENPFDITRIAKERFGIDISPQARAAAEAQAKQRQLAAAGSGAVQQFFAGQAGKPGSADQSIEQQREAIDADTTGAFDARRKGVIENVKLGDEQLDRARKQTIEKTNFDNENIENDEETNPTSELSARARDAASKLGLKVGDTTSYRTIKKVAPWLVDKLRIDKPTAGNQWGPADAAYLAQVGQIAQGLSPIDTEVAADGVSPKALQLGGQMLGAARGRTNTQDRFGTLRGAPAEKIRAYENTLNHLDTMKIEVPQKGSTGFIRNKVQRALWFGGMNDPQKAAVKAQLNMLLSQYILDMSGKASNEKEAARLAESVPNADDSAETLADKMEKFQEWTKRNLTNDLDSYELDGYTGAQGHRERAAQRGWLAGAPQAPAVAPEPNGLLGSVRQELFGAPRNAQGAKPPAGAQPERRQAKTPDGRTVQVERGADGRWHEVK